jgi:hypothetical protein
MSDENVVKEVWLASPAVCAEAQGMVGDAYDVPRHCLPHIPQVCTRQRRTSSRIIAGSRGGAKTRLPAAPSPTSRPAPRVGFLVDSTHIMQLPTPRPFRAAKAASFLLAKPPVMKRCRCVRCSVTFNAIYLIPHLCRCVAVPLRRGFAWQARSSTSNQLRIIRPSLLNPQVTDSHRIEAHSYQSNSRPRHS